MINNMSVAIWAQALSDESFQPHARGEQLAFARSGTFAEPPGGRLSVRQSLLLPVRNSISFIPIRWTPGTMDPTPEQLRSLDALEQLLDFSGVTLPLRSSILEALGDPTSVREMSFVSPGDLEEVLTTLRVPRPVAEGEGLTGPSIPVSPVQKGVVRFVLRVARLRAGLPVEGVSHQVTPETSPKVGVVAHPTRRVKLSSLVDSLRRPSSSHWRDPRSATCSQTTGVPVGITPTRT